MPFVGLYQCRPYPCRPYPAASVPIDEGQHVMSNASAGGHLHVALPLVPDKGAVRDQSDGLLDPVDGKEPVAVTAEENDRRLDAGKRRPRVERHLRLYLDQEVRGRVVLPGEQTAADPGAGQAAGPPAALARKQVLGEGHPETDRVAAGERR